MITFVIIMLIYLMCGWWYADHFMKSFYALIEKFAMSGMLRTDKDKKKTNRRFLFLQIFWLPLLCSKWLDYWLERLFRAEFEIKK